MKKIDDGFLFFMGAGTPIPFPPSGCELVDGNSNPVIDGLGRRIEVSCLPCHLIDGATNTVTDGNGIRIRLSCLSDSPTGFSNLIDFEDNFMVDISGNQMLTKP